MGCWCVPLYQKILSNSYFYFNTFITMFTSHFYIFSWILLIHIIKALQFLVFRLFLLRARTIHDIYSESWPWLLSWRQQSISRAGLTSSSKAPASGGIITVSFCQKSPCLWLFQHNGRFRRIGGFVILRNFHPKVPILVFRSNPLPTWALILI